MKKIIILLAILLWSCASTNSLFNSVENKENIGKVTYILYTNQGIDNSTFIKTDNDYDFFLDGKVKVSIGTELFIYYNSGSKYVIWKKAKEKHLIHQ